MSGHYQSAFSGIEKKVELDPIWHNILDQRMYLMHKQLAKAQRVWMENSTAQIQRDDVD